MRRVFSEGHIGSVTKADPWPSSGEISVNVWVESSLGMFQDTAVWTGIEMSRDFFVKTSLTFFLPNNSSN